MGSLAIPKGVNPFMASVIREVPNESLPVGGRLFHFRHQWTFLKWAHSIVSRSLGWKWASSPPPLRTFHQRETPKLFQLVSTIIEKSVIEKCKSFLSGEERLDREESDPCPVASEQVYSVQQVQNDDYSSCKDPSSPEAFTCFIDLSDTFWHVPVSRTSSRSPLGGTGSGSRQCLSD